MKYQNANSYFFSALSVLTLFSSFVAHAHIENTVISSYNLTTGKNVHYELLVSPRNQNTTVTLVPLEQNNKAASIFKISACINRYTGSSKQGEFHFSAAKAAQNDPRLSNFGTFVTEHNLHTVDSFKCKTEFAFYSGCWRSVSHRPLYIFILNKTLSDQLT